MNNSKIIALVVIFIILVVFTYVWFKPSPEIEVMKLEQQITLLQHQKDSLLLQLKQKDDTIYSLQDSIANIKVKVVYLKTQGNEKIDSVYNLPIDGAVEFLSNFLSKETNSTR